MKTRGAAFTLVEVVLALGIIVFSLLAVLGVFPAGLRQSATSILETRSTHLAHEVFAELRTPPSPGQALLPSNLYSGPLCVYGAQATPFGAVSCFGRFLNLPQMDEQGTKFDRTSPQVTLFADFPVSGPPTIQPGLSPDSPSPAYRIGLWFRKIPDTASPVGAPPALGYAVTLIVYPNDQTMEGVEFQSILGGY